MQLHYIVDLLRQMAEHGLGAVQCRQDVHDRYNDALERAHEKMVWTHPGMETYYRNSRGRVTVNYPYRNVDLFHATDFVLPPVQRGTRTLLTVHDLSFVRVPEAASPSLKAYLDTVVPRSDQRAS